MTLLDGVKTRLGITDTYHDAILNALIQDVQAFMGSAGVSPIKVSSDVGCIARGVSDLWNYGAGDGEFSDIFLLRVYQLSLETKDDTAD